MNTQREVFNKLFKEEKTELATKKIELGKIDELIKANDRAEKVLKSSKGAIQDLESAKKKSKKVLANIESEIRNMKPIKAEVFRALKELGGGKLLAPSQNPDYKKSIAIQNNLDSIYSELSRLLK